MDPTRPRHLDFVLVRQLAEGRKVGSGSHWGGTTVAEETVVENTTRIGLRADMTIDDEPVAVEGLLGGDFFLQLSRPATLGTPISFAYWLRDQYQVDNLDLLLPTESYEKAADFKAAYKSYKSKKEGREAFEAKIADHLKDKVPPQLVNLVKTAFLAELTITDLMIDIKAEDKETGTAASRKMMFGLSVGFPSPLALIPNVDVNKLSILVMNAPKNDFTFPPRVALPPSDPLPVEPKQATGSITFSDKPKANGTITLGKDEWKFATGAARGQGQVAIASTLEGTLADLAGRLNRVATGDTALCSYRANLDEHRLEITFKSPGFAGNEFAIAADGNSNGSASGLTLEGGFGETAPRQATGSFTFTAVPSDKGKITLNGTEWGFSGDEPPAGEKKSQIGADIPKTIDNLAKALTASDDPEIGKCAYVANGKSLMVTHVAAGSDGNKFTLAANGESKATPSGATLGGA